LSVYQIVKKMGIPDSHIILMSGLDVANDARNVARGEIFNTDVISDGLGNLLEEAEVDFSGDEVTTDLFIRVMLDRLPSSLPRGKRLLSGPNSNLLVFLSGHGGDEFFKFHDTEELSAQDLADTFHQMHSQRRFRSVLLMLETCQASTMSMHIDVPNVVTLASSIRGQNSYAYTTGREKVGVATVDRFTHLLGVYFSQTLLQTDLRRDLLTEGGNQSSSSSMLSAVCTSLFTPSLQSLFDFLSPSFLYSTPCIVHSSDRKQGGAAECSSDHGRDVSLIEYFANYEGIRRACGDLARSGTESLWDSDVTDNLPIRTDPGNEEEEEEDGGVRSHQSLWLLQRVRRHREEVVRRAEDLHVV
jgi:hypothetical protein